MTSTVTIGVKVGKQLEKIERKSRYCRKYVLK